MNRAEAEMIARAARILRPDWITSSLMTILEEFADQPTRRVHLALVWLAHDPDTKTPGRLRQPGPWWELDKPEQQAPTLPPPPPRLHEQHLGSIPTRTRIQEIRQQARQGAPK